MLSPSSCASIRAVAIARLPRSWPTSKGILITGACTRVSSFLHPIVRSSKKLKLNVCSANRRGNPRVGVLIAIIDIRQVHIAYHVIVSCHESTEHSHIPHVPNQIELAANVKANPLFMRWVFQFRPVVRSSTRTGVGRENTPIRRKHVAVK
jgi:hypothetical protein